MEPPLPDRNRAPGRILRKSPGPKLDKARIAEQPFARTREFILDRTFRITAGLHSDYVERQKHLAAIDGAMKDDNVWQLHHWLHENLIILDAKASSILAVNSIGIATLTFLYSTFDRNTPAIIYVGSLLSALLFLWAIVPLSRISFVYWSTTDDFLDHEKMLNELLLVRDKRTAIVRAALIKDAAGLGVFGVTIIIGALLKWVL